MYHSVNAGEELLKPHHKQWFQIYRNLPFDRYGFTEIHPHQKLLPGADYKPKRSLAPWGDLMHNRAVELLDTKENLLVCWSGGIDSTCIMVAMIQAGATKENLTVAMNRRSLLENTPFYERFIKGKFNTIEMKDMSELVATTDYHLVTGEGMDQLFGADVIYKIHLNAGLNVVFQPNTELNHCIALETLGFTYSNAKLIHHEVMGSAAKAGVKLRRVYDCMWWMNFAYKWQCVQLRGLMYGQHEYINQMTLDSLNRVSHFVNTPEFQDWSCTAHEKKIEDTWESYKLTAKRYIYRFDGDEEFLNNGIKILSLIQFSPSHVPKRKVFPPNV